MSAPPVQGRRVVQRVHGPVHPDPGVALVPQVVEQGRAVAGLAGLHRRQQVEAGSLRLVQQLVHDLLRRLPADQRPAHRAVRLPDPGPQQAQVVVDLGDRAHR
jgi:hypothetical protein